MELPLPQRATRNACGSQRVAMADKAHLDELIAQQTDPAARRLLEEFAKVIRDPIANSAERAAHLRQVMDALFTEATSAPAEPHSK